MPTSSILVIVIRIFVLQELLHSLWLIPSTVLAPMHFDRSLSSYVTRYGFIVIFLLFCYWLWKLAPWVAGIVCRKVEATVNFSAVTLADLYKFSFVFLGLFFVLSSIGDVINWVHYFAIVGQQAGPDPKITNIYQLTRPVLTLGAGFTSLLGAPLWTQKLLRKESLV